MQIHHETEEDSSKDVFISNFYRSCLIVNFVVTIKSTNEDFNTIGIKGYGTYILHYRYATRLYAISVVDVLPHTISSVYFCYDPEFKMLNLGLVSALLEIYLTKLLNTCSKNIIYYSLGYYIKNCPKMAYKSQYQPSFILCPVTLKWVWFEKCDKEFDLTKYNRLDTDNTLEPGNGPFNMNLQTCEIPFYRRLKIIRVKVDKIDIENDFLREYVEAVGHNLASNMLFYISTE
ncbi:hypothetical protein HZS_4458 [Henneguya salminicola]|nr:hypothetical protein HZS_4458 [Henneguya salminicola]